MMEQKNFNLIVATITFAAGAAFVLGNRPDITANVVGASGGSASLSSILGITLIIASSAFFVFVINHGDIKLENLIRQTKNHEEIKSKMPSDNIEEEYREKEEYQENKD